MAKSALIYTATAGYRHDSIPTAISVVEALGAQHGFTTFATEDPSYFITANLALYDVLVFISNSDEVLDQNGKAAMLQYFQAGGNYVGVHSASACLNTTQYYGNVVGAFFDRHPDIQSASFEVVDASHPSTMNLPTPWTFEEEVYNFMQNPRSPPSNVKLLLTVDESSYTDSLKAADDRNHGTPHPIAWYQTLDYVANQTSLALGGGRSWYTSLGHLNSTWMDPTYQAHILGGIQWVLASTTGPNGTMVASSLSTASVLSTSTLASVQAATPTMAGTTSSVAGSQSGTAMPATLSTTTSTGSPRASTGSGAVPKLAPAGWRAPSIATAIVTSLLALPALFLWLTS